jgi:hypothetical protein
MITITTFTLAADFQSIDIEIDAGAGNIALTLLFYVGSNYLTQTSVDLSDRLAGVETQTLNITKEELGITDDVIDGIITVKATASDASIVEASILNSYYTSLVLARKIATENTEGSFKEIETIFFLLEATKTYIDSGMTEQALNTFGRVQSMCENYPYYMLIEDLPQCSVGSGCWIINGKYVIY